MYENKGISNTWDPYGLVVAFNSKESDVFKLEAVYPYLKVGNLWRSITTHTSNLIYSTVISNIFSHAKSLGISEDDYHRYKVKIRYNLLYVRITPAVVDLLTDDLYLESRSIWRFDWKHLEHELAHFTSEKLEEYTIRKVNFIPDDTLYLKALYKYLRLGFEGQETRTYPTMLKIVSLILGIPFSLKLGKFDYRGTFVPIDV
jgi:hypothetical protein